MRKIITISREFGSGGRELGKRLAEKLNFAYYDREIITEISKKMGVTEEYAQKLSERGIYKHAFQIAKSFTVYSEIQNNQTEILVAQQKILKNIAENGNAVIIGRGANVILKKYNPMNIFVYADMEAKINRCRMKVEEDRNLSDKEMENKIKQIDKNRKNYHKIISNLEWGDKRNYDLCINTSNLEIKKIIPALAEFIGEYFGGDRE
ncbi:MAG: cytidylate kinase-like family protein [Clostridia bacterium]|jgi:cytidylate kinase|nr:cytidylate kinase-like family protein [Clostridia bacterium]